MCAADVVINKTDTETELLPCGYAKVHPNESWCKCLFVVLMLSLWYWLDNIAKEGWNGISIYINGLTEISLRNIATKL